MNTDHLSADHKVLLFSALEEPQIELTACNITPCVCV